MSLSGSGRPGSGSVVRVYRLVGIVILILSIAAFFLALWTGGLVAAIRELLRAIGLVSGSGQSPYPLAAWVLVIYVAGAVLGCFVHRWPMGVGGVLVPLGIVAFAFGGPISQVYGVSIVVVGVLLVGMVLRSRRSAGHAVE